VLNDLAPSAVDVVVSECRDDDRSSFWLRARLESRADAESIGRQVVKGEYGPV